MRFRLGCLFDQMTADDLVCVFHLFVHEFCMSNVDTLSLNFSFHLHGFCGPGPWLFVHGFLSPDPWLFSSWVLGSHSLAVSHSFHHLSTGRSPCLRGLQHRSSCRAVLLVTPSHSLVFTLLGPLLQHPSVLLISIHLLVLLFPKVSDRLLSSTILNQILPANLLSSIIHQHALHIARDMTVVFFPAVFFPGAAFGIVQLANAFAFASVS